MIVKLHLFSMEKCIPCGRWLNVKLKICENSKIFRKLFGVGMGGGGGG